MQVLRRRTRDPAGSARQRRAPDRCTDDDGRGGPAEHVGQRPLGEQPAGAHDPDVGGDLLDLGEQVAGDQDGGAVSGELTDQVADLAGALRIQAVRRLVEDQQVARLQQCSRQPEPLLHPRASTGGTSCRAAASARPGRARPRCAGAGRRVGGRIAGIQAAQVVRPERYGWKAGPFDQGADARQDTPRGGRHRLAEQLDLGRCAGPPARAASGSSSSCRSRWARGTRTPRLAGRPG